MYVVNVIVFLFVCTVSGRHVPVSSTACSYWFMMRAAESLVSLADHLHEIEKNERAGHLTGVLTLPCQLEGRIFDCLGKYALLPIEIQAQADLVAMYLLSSPETCAHLFRLPWYRKGLRQNPRVKGQRFMDWILSFLKVSKFTKATHDYAAQLAEALLLCGFVSPIGKKWACTSYPRPVSGHMDGYMYPDVKYELVCPAGITPATSISVWSVTDGATRAGFVVRTQLSSTQWPFRRICDPLMESREKVYLVINKSKYRLYCFPNDVAQQALGFIHLVDAMVQYQVGINVDHSLKLWKNEHFEYFHFQSSHDADAWLLSLLDAGATYIESHPHTCALASCCFYDLHDREANGNVIWFRRFQGQVVLIVNTATKDPEAAIQFPQLVHLMTKYEADGFVVIACPCEQFTALECHDVSDKEMAQHLRQIYHINFPILCTRNVNGPHSRHVFVWLNTQLNGIFGPCVQWNFTKFLIDRQGQPYQRYGTQVLPQDMEMDIQTLLYNL